MATDPKSIRGVSLVNPGDVPLDGMEPTHIKVRITRFFGTNTTLPTWRSSQP